MLQNAHAGELAAAFAYRGHWKSIRRSPAVKAEIRRIEAAEWHHRALAREMLDQLGAVRRIPREVGMWLTGRFFGLLCFVTPKFGPMYAAGRLEAQNVDQYVDAQRYAGDLGLSAFAATLGAMVEEEARHEAFFAEQCRGSVFLPIAVRFGGWDAAELDARPRPTDGS